MFARTSTRLLFLRQYCQSYKNQPTTSQVKTDESRPSRCYGQPTSETHPYLLRAGEVMPGIRKSEFEERRQRLMDSIVQYAKKNHKVVDKFIVVIPSATKQYMSEKIPYVFRQNSDFLYLSGCLEPDSCLVLTLTNDSSRHCATLFMRLRDSDSEVWDGPRTGPENACRIFGVEQSLGVGELENYIGCFTKPATSTLVYYDILSNVQPAVQKIMVNCFKNTTNKLWESPKAFVHKLRVIKSKAEIDLMRKSCEIASNAIAKTIGRTKPGMTEHHLYATVDYECRMEGAEYLAYPPVVAGGPRATIIHYINNNQVLRGNEMVLMDAGCEYRSYTSDITRTWPVSGKFTDEQKVLYECVLEVQQDLINMCYQFPTLDKMFDSMCVRLGKKLQQAGLIPSSATEQEMARVAFQFCPHHVSHYLGMDVHDTPTVPRSIRIVPGMVVTVEPGLYITANAKVPEKFKGLGVRIEDDVLITESGPEVLTQSCPKKLADIEKLVSKD